MGFREKDLRDQVPFSSHFIKGPYYNMTSWLSLTLTPLAEVVCVRLLCKVILLPTPHTVLLGRKLLCTAYTEGVGSYVLFLWGWSIYIKYLKFTTGNLFILPNYLLISVWTHGYLLHTLGYNLIRIYLPFCSDCASFGSWELFQLAVCLWYTPIIPCVCCLSTSLLSYYGCSRLIWYVFCPFPRNTVSLRIHGSFYWRMVLESKIWALGEMITIGEQWPRKMFIIIQKFKNHIKLDKQLYELCPCIRHKYKFIEK